MSSCEELNRHYVETRYPTETLYTKEVSERAIKIAEEVVEWVKERIEK